MIARLKILLVDDSSVILDVMKELLSGIDCIAEMNTTSSPLKVSGILQHNMPDIMLLDINMPGKNGIEVLKEVKELHPEIKVIMVTNHSTDYYRKLCLSLGADHFIDKTNEFDQIPVLIEKIAHQQMPLLQAI